MKVSFIRFIQFLVISITLTVVQAQKQPSVGEKPSWVVVQKFSASVNDDQSPFKYLLVDNQKNANLQQNFFHVAIHLFNSDGVQEMSSISIDYDPSYQTLIIHDISIHRGDEIQKRSRDGFQILQREQDLQRSLYDGTLTALKELEDIRKGDVIEYSYTITGYNPLFGEDRFAVFYQDYSLPVDYLYQSIVTDQKMNVYYTEDAKKADLSKEGDNWIYKWVFTDVDAVFEDYTVPSWYSQYNFVSMSTMGDWIDVVDWAKDLYELTPSERNQLRKEIEQKLSLDNSDDNVLSAIRFVQDEIRYLGFEDGVNAFKPHAPLTVWKQRFGDCKDKSFLLSAILSEMGIDASPMLVHNLGGEILDIGVPGPNQFNHCIVTFNKDGNSYVVDPTISYQGGDLNHMVKPNYKRGLPIRQNVKGLIEFEEDIVPQVIVEEVFIIDSIPSGAQLDIETKYTGQRADYQRSYFNSNSRSEIKKSYKDYYQNAFPDITLLSLEMIDSLRDTKNEIIVKESYHIENLWNGEKDFLRFEVSALVLDDYVSLGYPESDDTPYWLGNQVEYIQTTKVHLPEPWAVTNDVTQVKNEYFDYRNSIEYYDEIITLKYRYYLKNGVVEKSDVDKVLEDLTDVNNDLTFSITYNKALLDSLETSNIAWQFWVLVLIGILFSGFIIRWIYVDFNVYTDQQPPGLSIGGWLVFPAIGLVLNPIKVIIQYGEIIYEGSYSAAAWQMLWANEIENGQAILWLLCFESIINVIIFMVGIILAVLFFKRRSNIPVLMIWFYILTFLFFLLDGIFAQLLMPEESLFSKELLRAFIACCIWAPYFKLSTRVKETFVYQIDPKISTNNDNDMIGL